MSNRLQLIFQSLQAVLFVWAKGFLGHNWAMPKKVRELKQLLKKAGFTSRPEKGSHSVWKHPKLIEVIVIARKDGADAPKYLDSKCLPHLKRWRKWENDISLQPGNCLV